MSGIVSAKLFAQVAILRRRILLRQMIVRALAGLLGAAALLVTAALATYAGYLAIRPMLGELNSVLVLAAGYLVIAITLIAFTLHEPASPELDALSEIEAAALEATMNENRDVLDAFTGVGSRLHDIGSTVTLGLGVLSTLRKLLAATATRKSS